MTPDEIIKDLQKEIRLLRKIAYIRQREVRRNKYTIDKLFRMADIFQSFIPDRDKWRDVYLSTAN